MAYKIAANKNEEAEKLKERAWHYGRTTGIDAANLAYSMTYPERDKKIVEWKEIMRKDFFDGNVFFHKEIPEEALKQLLAGFDYGFKSETESRKADDLRDLCP